MLLQQRISEKENMRKERTCEDANEYTDAQRDQKGIRNRQKMDKEMRYVRGKKI